VFDRLYNLIVPLGIVHPTLPLIRKELVLAELHYKTWEESVKLEADNSYSALQNLPVDTKKMQAEINWFFKLLNAYVNEGES
jgi:hypothetical protein